MQVAALAELCGSRLQPPHSCTGNTRGFSPEVSFVGRGFNHLTSRTLPLSSPRTPPTSRTPRASTTPSPHSTNFSPAGKSPRAAPPDLLTSPACSSAPFLTSATAIPTPSSPPACLPGVASECRQTKTLQRLRRSPRTPVPRAHQPAKPRVPRTCLSTTFSGRQLAQARNNGTTVPVLRPPAPASRNSGPLTSRNCPTSATLEFSASPSSQFGCMGRPRIFQFSAPQRSHSCPPGRVPSHPFNLETTFQCRCAPGRKQRLCLQRSARASKTSIAAFSSSAASSSSH